MPVYVPYKRMVLHSTLSSEEVLNKLSDITHKQELSTIKTLDNLRKEGYLGALDKARDHFKLSQDSSSLVLKHGHTEFTVTLSDSSSGGCLINVSATLRLTLWLVLIVMCLFVLNFYRIGYVDSISIGIFPFFLCIIMYIGGIIALNDSITAFRSLLRRNSIISAL